MNDTVAAICAECNEATTGRIYDGYKCGVCAGIDVTVLKDESLGGVEREYREVKRKANVGERIVFDSDRPGITEGKPYNVTGGDCDGAEFYDNDGTRRWQSHVGANCYTLEPTDIVRINGERFRMVDRKATVGERVVVVSSNNTDQSGCGFRHKLGEIGRVARLAELYSDRVLVNGWYILNGDYRVLEPLTAAEPTPLLSAQSAPDQAAELIAKLTTRVAALEKRVATLETASEVTDEEVAETFRIALDPPVYSGVAKAVRIKSPQEIRDDIVKRAKEDVAKLIADAHGDNDSVWMSLPATKRIGHVRVEFVVDREKRKVTALAYLRYSYGSQVRGLVGRSVCAAGDVFNVWIGKAIAVRRLLGLEVPEEYLSAPNPTEVRVGDIVEGTSHSGAIGPVLEIGHDGEENFVIYRNDTNLSYVNKCWSGVTRVIILDDTREDNAEPRKEVA